MPVNTSVVSEGPIDAYSQVDRVLDKAEELATNAQSAMSAFTAALNTSLYAAPTISLTWNSIVEPDLPDVTPAPSLQAIAFTAPNAPATTALPSVSINIDDFTEVAPDITIPSAPSLSFGTAPTIPEIGEVALPSAPTLSAVALPTMLSLSTPTFAGVDLRPDWLTKLEEMPELTLVSPTPFSYARDAEYASALLSALKAKLASRLDGGSGLAPAVEQAIWDRARSRETATALANEAEIARASEALGFDLPSGVLAAQLREAQQNYYDKLSTLSRDVAIKQAELEQENLKQTIAAGMQLEGQLIDYCYKREQSAFQAAKEYADNAIALHNVAVEAYKALLAGYQTYASTYKTIIDGELAKVEVYKSELQAEQTKASINQALVQQYKTQIEAGMAQVDIYKAQVGAAQTLVSLEQAKIGAAGEQIRAYTAMVNAEVAKVEAFKAEVQAQGSVVEMYKTKAQAFSAKVGAQGEKARAEISRYSAIAQSNAALWEGYKAEIQGKIAAMEAIRSTNSQLIDAYRAENSATEAVAGMATKVWETKIKDYESSMSLMLQQAKANNDALTHANQAKLDAAKVGAQVYSQLTASAYSMMHGSASISGSTGNSVSYSYSNDTASPGITPSWA